MRSFLIPLSLLATVYATRVPFEVHLTDKPSAAGLTRRAATAVGNTGNAQYVANISIAGNNVPVLLDTGSSDLWVYFPTTPSNIDQLQDTGTEVSLNYAIGRAHGTAHRGPVSFAGYTVRDQPFLYVKDASTFSSDIHDQGYDGLFGLGPNSGSVIRKKLDKKGADTFMQNIFNNADLDRNYITVLLDRKKDPSDPFQGQMTISEIIPEFANITSAPKLDVDTVMRLLKSDQHWQALTDKDNGIIGPDGNPIKLKSIVPGAPDEQMVAVIDTGFTFSQVPREVADQIYGRVKGAAYDAKNEWWLVPCGQYLNISFNFAGVNYPIHPLDTVDDNFDRYDATGKKVCIGSFQPITTAFSLLGHYDMILGMSFLRSVYALFDFGEWIENGTGDHPFIQMVSHTNPRTARADFVQTRLAGLDTISDARWQLLPMEQMQASPVSDEEKKKKYQEMVLSRWPYILGGCLAFVVICVGLCVWRCCCRKAKAKGAKGGKGNAKGGLKSRFGFGGGREKEGRKELEDAYNSGAFSESSGKAGEALGAGRSPYGNMPSQTHLPLGRNASAVDLGERPSGQYERPSGQYERPSGQYERGVDGRGSLSQPPQQHSQYHPQPQQYDQYDQPTYSPRAAQMQAQNPFASQQSLHHPQQQQQQDPFNAPPAPPGYQQQQHDGTGYSQQQQHYQQPQQQQQPQDGYALDAYPQYPQQSYGQEYRQQGDAYGGYTQGGGYHAR
ncbi:acid protease [Coprinopsis marcescibilis]|uniref:Acid protease n=1 Tax=Coprinopsis marcescibilis TaxID=230819 RepID=A0A5C3KWL5_COPMA|nr:acid protease [Coprinopsis marcescibilis]